MPDDCVFPPYFPHDCPPPPLMENPGTYYRLVRSAVNLPIEEFHTTYEKNNGILTGGLGSRCRDCAVSLYDTIDHASGFLENHPNFAQRCILSIHLSGGHGVVQLGGKDGHVSWWVPVRVSRLNFIGEEVFYHAQQ